ncbi:MAG: carbohydrate binding domain-containing protein [Prevotella sp.]|nr:carbohydrate binding domain-containing protein [Prevotella sp.]
MKKILYTIMALAISAFALQSCEDVPEPYTIPGQETGGGEGNKTEPAGDGTVATPYNIAAALDVCANLQQSSTSASYLSEEVYVKGKVSSIVDTEFNSQFGNITYYISDVAEDGTTTNKLEVYRGYGLNGAKFTSLDDIKVGDEVIVKGKLQNWLGTYEFTQGSSLYSLNGNASGGDQTGEAKGEGTLENPYNSVAANSYVSSLPANQNSDNEIYIKGKVVSVNEQFGTQFGNATFYISDDGTAANQFYVFRALYLGNQKYTSGALLKEGDEVVVCGKVVNYYGNTPETVQGQAYVYSINGKTTSDASETPGGGETEDPVNPDAGSLIGNGDFEIWNGSTPANWKTTSTAGNATLSKSTEAHGGQYSVSVGYYESANKRMAYQETELEAGTYVFSFYAKATNGGKCQTRAGYVPVTDGKVGSYAYDNYVDLTSSEWKLVTYEFQLAAKSTVCLVIMNPKKSSYNDSQNILVDDAKLIKK